MPSQLCSIRPLKFLSTHTQSGGCRVRLLSRTGVILCEFHRLINLGSSYSWLAVLPRLIGSHAEHCAYYEWGFSPLDLRRREDCAGLLRGKACAGSFFLRQITHEPPSSSGLYARGSLHRASTEGCPLFAIVLGCFVPSPLFSQQDGS